MFTSCPIRNEYKPKPYNKKRKVNEAFNSVPLKIE